MRERDGRPGTRHLIRGRAKTFAGRSRRKLPRSVNRRLTRLRRAQRPTHSTKAMPRRPTGSSTHAYADRRVARVTCRARREAAVLPETRDTDVSCLLRPLHIRRGPSWHSATQECL